MRVLQIGPWPPPHGGVQSNLVAIHEHLRSIGVESMVINITRFRGEDGDGVYFPANARELLKLLLVLQYDILHLHLGGNITPRLLRLCLVCNFIPGTKSVLTFHSGGYPSSYAGQRVSSMSLTGIILRQFDGLISVNQDLFKFFRRCGAPESKIRLIYPHTVTPPGPEVRLREDLQRFYDSHSPVLLGVAGLEPEYDVPLQIDALEYVREQHPNAGLAIIGAGSLEQEIRAHIAAKPYSGNILLAGDVPHDVTLRAIEQSHMLLRTTLYDGDSICVRESLHLGTPVIASDNGMRPAGCDLFPAEDLDGLLDAIESRLERGKSVYKRGDSGQENVEQVVRLYRELTAVRR
jgi:glycosyltransferase involved in cell wall biosynthesis